MSKKSFISIAIWLTVASILGKLLGFGKDILISYYYGTSAATDALFLAMSIPTIILGIFTSSTDSSIIPQYNRLCANFGRLRADENFSNILNIFSLVGIILSSFIFFFPGIILNVFAPGFDIEQTTYAIKFLRLFSFFGFLHILYCYFTAYSVRYQHVVIRSVLAFSTNILVIVALLVNPDNNMVWLSVAFFVGYIIQGFLPMLGVKYLGYNHKWRISFKDPEYKHYWYIFFPILLTSLLRNLNVFVDNFIASNMGSGGISSLNYASRLTSIFDTMIVVGIGVAILPKLSSLNISGQKKQFVTLSTQIVKLLFIVLLPVMLLIMFLSREIVEVVYLRGEFTQESLIIVSSLLIMYAPRVLFLPLQAVIVRFFHATENTKLPMRVTGICVCINIILSFSLSHYWGLRGVAIATSTSIFIANMMLVFFVIRKVGWNSNIFGFTHFAKILISASSIIFMISIVNMIGLRGINKIIITTMGGGIVYIVCILVLMPTIVSEVNELVRRKKST